MTNGLAGLKRPLSVPMGFFLRMRGFVVGTRGTAAGVGAGCGWWVGAPEGTYSSCAAPGTAGTATPAAGASTGVVWGTSEAGPGVGAKFDNDWVVTRGFRAGPMDGDPPRGGGPSGPICGCSTPCTGSMLDKQLVQYGNY